MSETDLPLGAFHESPSDLRRVMLMELCPYWRLSMEMKLCLHSASWTVTILYCTTLHYTTLHYTILVYGVVLYSSLFYFLFYSILFYSILLYSIL